MYLFADSPRNTISPGPTDNISRMAEKQWNASSLVCKQKAYDYFKIEILHCFPLFNEPACIIWSQNHWIWANGVNHLINLRSFYGDGFLCKVKFN